MSVPARAESALPTATAYLFFLLGQNVQKINHVLVHTTVLLVLEISSPPDSRVHVAVYDVVLSRTAILESKFEVRSVVRHW